MRLRTSGTWCQEGFSKVDIERKTIAWTTGEGDGTATVGECFFEGRGLLEGAQAFIGESRCKGLDLLGGFPVGWALGRNQPNITYSKIRC
jgi:hypothetical protein